MAFKIQKDPERLGDRMVVDEERGVTLKLWRSGRSAVKTFRLEWPNGECFILAEWLYFPERNTGAKVEWNVYKIEPETLTEEQKETARTYLVEALDIYGLTASPRHSGRVKVYFENYPHKGRGYDI